MIAARRRARARRRALADIHRRVLAAEPAEDLLRLITRRAREAVGADAARVLLAEPGEAPAVWAADGVEAPEPSGPSAGARRGALCTGGFVTVLDTPLTVGGRTVGVLEVADRRRRRFTSGEQRALRRFAAPAALAAAQLRTREQLRRLAAVGASDGVGRTLDQLAAAAVAHTGAAECAVRLLEPDGTAPGDAPEEVRDAVASAAPVTRTLRDGRTGTAWPLLCEGRVTGVLHCRYPPGRRPDGLDLTLLEGIAGHAARAVEGERWRAAARDKGALDERRRLSRELHDSVSQALYGIALGARTARELLNRNAEQDTDGMSELAEPIDYIRQLADAAIADTRVLLGRLRPEALEAEGLVAALTRHVTALRDRYGIAAEATLGAEPETTPEAKHALFRIAQESLHNVAKHSGARHVRLHLLSGPGTVTLTVADDGVGFDSRRSFPGHLGLLSMRERAREVGGTLNVDSRPGQGSRIRATVPAGP
ncbi:MULTISPECIES: GAF domain-containing sensor histidine kinase [unclassified Streptomyces]|uniref:GAF domain-containing sensor histidine kinase n=1 Tax=unclassified Streptomyces TaxID=2593676 RepID=UPI00336A8625